MPSGARWKGVRRTENEEIRRYKQFPTPAFAQIVLCIQQDGEVIPQQGSQAKTPCARPSRKVSHFSKFVPSPTPLGVIFCSCQEAAGVRCEEMLLT
jgi:hypothetical protein